MRGAQILFYPTAIGWLADEREEFGQSQWSAWETMMRSHAIANGVFVAAPNRVGIEGELNFWGASFVADPNGNVIARGSHDQEELVLAECNLQQVDAARTFLVFADSRCEHGFARSFVDNREVRTSATPRPGDRQVSYSDP